MNMMRFVLGLSLVALLVLVSQSHPTAAVDVSMPSRRAVVEHTQETDEHTSFQPRKLGVHIRKGGGGARGGGARGGGARGGGARGGGARGGGRLVRGAGAGAGAGRSSSSSAVPARISSFHFASILGCSFILVIFLL